MAKQEAIWHVIIADNEIGPLSHEQVLDYLRSGALLSGDLIWRAGYTDWISVRDVPEIWRPSKRTARTDLMPSHADDVQVRERLCLWNAANLGLVLSFPALLTEVVTGNSFELANYAQIASIDTIGELVVRVLGAPLIFVAIALVRNILTRNLVRSRASALRGGLTFAGLIILISGLLFGYGMFFISRNAAIEGETNKVLITRLTDACLQKQRSLSQNMSETELTKYCSCVSDNIAETTTFKQIGSELGTEGLANLKQEAEAAGNACRR